MSKREIAAIIALMVAGFVAYEVISQFPGGEPDEVAPGGVPETASPTVGEGPSGEMRAIVPAVRATELSTVMHQQHGLPELSDDAGFLAIAGNPGEFFFTRHRPGGAEVCVMRATGPEVIWSTETDDILEIVGAHGSELLLKFVDRPFDDPADAWEPGGFYGLDVFATGVGVYPSHLDDETVAGVRRTIR